MTSSDHLDSALSTLQHIENLDARAQALEERRIEAEEQMLHRVGAAYEAGQLSLPDLIEIYERYKQLNLAGRMTRWNAAIPIYWSVVPTLSRHIPNAPGGTWSGAWPFDPDDRLPPTKSFIVYVLFDATNEPIYVGSSGHFRNRLKAHARNGIIFVRWWACPAADREAAYQLEEKLLRERLPKLNKRAGR